MSWFGPDKRQSDRGEDERRASDCTDSDRKGVDRGQTQRRQYFRVIYPPAAAPKIINIPAQVVDISVKAVRFIPIESAVEEFNLNHGDKTDMTLKFHDGQVIEASGTVLREETNKEGKKFYICTFNVEIPSAVINKEQAYLLKNFPDFCRNKFKF